MNDMSDSNTTAVEAGFSMFWEDEAKELLSFAPEAIVPTVIKNCEKHAAEKGEDKVSRSTMADLMKGMGMDLDSLLTSCPYAAGKQKNT